MNKTIRIGLVVTISKDVLYEQQFIYNLLPNRYYTIYTASKESVFMSPILKSKDDGTGIIYTKASASDISYLDVLSRSVGPETKITKTLVALLDLIPESSVTKLDLFGVEIIPKIKDLGFTSVIPSFPEHVNILFDISDFFIEEEDMKRGISITNQKKIGNETNLMLVNYGSEEVRQNDVKIYFLSRRKESITDEMFKYIYSALSQISKLGSSYLIRPVR